MLDLTTVATFVVVVTGILLVPGPAVLIVLSRTAQGGRKIGFLTCLGLALGDVIHAVLAAAGLSAILTTSAMAFNIVKYLGAAYLIYLGIKAIMDKGPSASKSETHNLPPARAFFQAIIIETCNPKTAIFFLAFLPPFVDPEVGSVFFQFMTLGLIFVVMGLCYTILLVLISPFLSGLLGRVSFLRRWQGHIIGAIFISLGLKVALQKQ